MGFRKLFFRLFPKGTQGSVIKGAVTLRLRRGSDEVSNAGGVNGDRFPFEIKQEPNSIAR